VADVTFQSAARNRAVHPYPQLVAGVDRDSTREVATCQRARGVPEVPARSRSPCRKLTPRLPLLSRDRCALARDSRRRGTVCDRRLRRGAAGRLDLGTREFLPQWNGGVQQVRRSANYAWNGRAGRLQINAIASRQLLMLTFGRTNYFSDLAEPWRCIAPALATGQPPQPGAVARRLPGVCLHRLCKGTAWAYTWFNVIARS